MSELADAAAVAEAPAAAAAPRIPALVLGGSGYVAGELLRLLAGHPILWPAAVLSSTRAGDLVERAFPHLAGSLAGLAFAGTDDLPRRLDELVSLGGAGSGERAAELGATPAGAPSAVGRPRVAAFCAAPHGAAAPLVARLLEAADRSGCDLALVDLSADFRFAEAAAWTRVYGEPHGAPAALSRFTCAIPELRAGVPSRCLAHPGCFTTAVLLGAVPLVRAGLVAPDVVAIAITGSTGAGRTPTAATHHPERRSNLFAYGALAHRHQPEMESLATAAGAPLRAHFVPHSGPFARGIHATLVLRPRGGADAASARAALVDAYRDAPFVSVSEEPPRLQHVVGTNRCHLGVAADGETLIVFSVLDNLVKGASGGAVQWMNRLLGVPETTGLVAPGLGWL